MLVLQDIMLEKDLDRADEMIVYLLARPGCNFDFGLYSRLKEISMSVVRNELTGEQLFALFFSVAFNRWSEEKQDFQHIDNFKPDDKSEDSAEEIHKSSNLHRDTASVELVFKVALIGGTSCQTRQ